MAGIETGSDATQELFPVIHAYDAAAQSLEDILAEYNRVLKFKLKLKVLVVSWIPARLLLLIYTSLK